jgi:hypothetical protein
MIRNLDQGHDIEESVPGTGVIKKFLASENVVGRL